MNVKRENSVTIVGAGPAGCAAAICLARAGWSVTILERELGSRLRPGEALPPDATPLLRQLGLWREFLTTSPVESIGNLSLWGSNKPAATDFIFSPYGNGWHVDRFAFDNMLVQNAVAGGADLRIGALGLQAQQKNSQWQVKYRDGSGLHRTTASWLIVATGRGGRCVVPHVRRVQTDRLAACFSLTSAGDDADVRTWIEAAPDGWWYSAPLPDRQLALAYFTDADLLPKSADARRLWLRENIAKTNLMRTRVSSAPTDWRVVDARTGYHLTPVKASLCFVGDAALSLDPLSSSGLVFALESGCRAAEELSGESVNETYPDWLSRFRENYLREYHHFYGMEQRWSSSIFWTRRRKGSLTANELLDRHR